MTTFDERRESFEAKFAHDEELRFRATARRDKALGLWAAEKLGLRGEEAETYARELVRTDIREHGDRDVFRKLRQDFDTAGVRVSDHQIERTMNDLLARAVADIESGR